MILIKRIYEPSGSTDGYRILIDRVWPRGISKEQADIGLWAKDIAPSVSLRKWFNHEPEKFQAFKKAYLKEIEQNEAFPAFLEQIKAHKTITLLYGAKDEKHNHAIVLEEYLKSH